MATERSCRAHSLAAGLALLFTADLASAAETSCSDGFDDDGNGLTDCADVDCAFVVTCADFDSDGDGVLNRNDCAPADSQVWAGGEAEATGLRGLHVGGTTALLWWDDLSSVLGPTATYEVGTGVITELHANGGMAPGASVLASGLTSPTLMDARPIVRLSELADGYWYLVSASDACRGRCGVDGDAAPWEERAANCDNEVDDDGDTLVDCLDRDCTKCACPSSARLAPARIEAQYLDAILERCGETCFVLDVVAGVTLKFDTCASGGPFGIDTVLRLRSNSCIVQATNDNDFAQCGAGNGGSAITFTIAFPGTILVCIDMASGAAPTSPVRLRWRRL